MPRRRRPCAPAGRGRSPSRGAVGHAHEEPGRRLKSCPGSDRPPTAASPPSRTSSTTSRSSPLVAVRRSPSRSGRRTGTARSGPRAPSRPAGRSSARAGSGCGDVTQDGLEARPGHHRAPRDGRHVDRARGVVGHVHRIGEADQRAGLLGDDRGVGRTWWHDLRGDRERAGAQDALDAARGRVTRGAPRRSAATTVFTSSMARVIGPTPPGTGVMAPATSATPRTRRRRWSCRPLCGSCPRRSPSRPA